MSDYYQDHAAAYSQRTKEVDPSGFLGSLVRCLPAGARILDVGCGGGRDLAWLKGRGFEVWGFERSAALAALARRHAACEVVEADFEVFDFRVLPVDAVILVGALVHLAPSQLPQVLERILGALGPWSADGGWAYVSLKEGRGAGRDPDGRRFYLWRDEDLRTVFENLRLTVHHFAGSPSVLGTGEPWLGYVLRADADRVLTMGRQAAKTNIDAGCIQHHTPNTKDLIQ